MVSQAGQGREGFRARGEHDFPGGCARGHRLLLGIVLILMSISVKESPMARAKTVPSPAQTSEAAAEEPWSFSLVEVLREEAARSEGSKADRTLLKLKAGAAATLNSMPYQTMRIADVVKAAGVS